MISSIGIGFILTCIFVGAVLLVGLFTLFAKAENIERPVLVGGMTASTTLVAMVLLDHDYRVGFPFGGGALFSVCFLAAAGFGLGRVIDFFMGPRAHEQAQDSTLGSDLAD